MVQAIDGIPPSPAYTYSADQAVSLKTETKEASHKTHTDTHPAPPPPLPPAYTVTLSLAAKANRLLQQGNSVSVIAAILGTSDHAIAEELGFTVACPKGPGPWFASESVFSMRTMAA